MFRRWLLYLTVLVGCVIFAFAYNGWFSWLLLNAVFFLPAAVLLISLPAMLMTKVHLHCRPVCIPMQKEKATLSADCPLPAPIFHGKLRVAHSFSGQTKVYRMDANLPTEHCGQLRCYGVRVRIYDYLGLFFLPVRNLPVCSILIRPLPIPATDLPDLERHLSTAWKPKYGGGFSENHELRLYRPGDNLNQIHWKLSAKTGNYIVREAMEPLQNALVLNLELRGSPEQLDRKLGILLWVSNSLLEKQRHHRIRVLSGENTHSFSITDSQSLSKALDKILSFPPAAEGFSLEPVSAIWQYTPGGDADES